MVLVSEQLILDNLSERDSEEQELRLNALGLVARDSQLGVHVSLTGHAMILADQFRKLPSDVDDLQAIQMRSMRTFTAFGSRLKSCPSPGVIASTAF